MANSRCATYNEFVNDALTQKNHNSLHAAAKGHKRAFEVGSSQQKTPMATKPQYHPPTPWFRLSQKKTQFNQQQILYCSTQGKCRIGKLRRAEE